MNQRNRPKSLGRDGITVMVNHDRALRAREQPRPSADEMAKADATLASLLARVLGKRP